MDAILIRSVPKKSYWFMGVWLYPIASIIFTAVLLIPVLGLLHHHPSRRLILTSWIIVTLAISIWACTRDYRRLHFTLTSNALVWGRGNAAVLIPFSEIDSIVTGLPDRLPWWIQIQRYFGGLGVWQTHSVRWKNVPVLRLSGSRYLPLDPGSGRLFLSRFDALVAELLRLNAHKVVDRRSYTEGEVRSLVAARYNTIMKIVAR